MTDAELRGDLRPPSLNADEKTTLLTFLDYLREAVAAKASCLFDKELRTAGVPSGTSILGLIKHHRGRAQLVCLGLRGNGHRPPGRRVTTR